MTERRIMFLVGLLGWVLFGVSIWYHHRAPSTPEYLKPETSKALEEHGFTEGVVTKKPPPEVITKTEKIPGAERIVFVEVQAPPTETGPPEVRYVAGNCAQPDGPQAANWTLRSGDLGLRDGKLDVRKAGRRPFVAFTATLTAQTPDGEVTRAVDPDEQSWFASSTMALPPRFGPAFRFTTLPTAEAGVYWTRDRLQHDATAGYDFDRQRWFGGYGIRF